ncbi:MAG: phospholipase D-like domain-containing protein [Phototrophicaceae bacterium]
MTKKKSSNNSGPSFIIGIVIIVLGFIIYAVTGVDLLGITSIPDDTTVIQSPRISTGDFTEIDIPLGLGYQGDFWQVYFTTPLNGRDRSLYVDGVDIRLAAAINTTRNTLDIAAFELNNEVITEAIIDAHNRGVVVRVVTDDEHGLEDDDSTIVELELAGIEIVDDSRTALMHNKFMIMDGITVWLGSMNYTMNGVYRNNNNAISLRSRRAVETYQAEFDEMFERGEFGPRSDPSNIGNFSQDGVPIQIQFASENEVVDMLLTELENAQSTIRFMTFSFTRDDLGLALLSRASAGVDIQGVFETTGSETIFSEMPRLYCAGLNVRQDGNSGILHHKVFIIDESTVITGSFNFSNNAVESNDENVLIIRDTDIAALYTDEFLRVQSISRAVDPDDVDC